MGLSYVMVGNCNACVDAEGVIPSLQTVSERMLGRIYFENQRISLRKMWGRFLYTERSGRLYEKLTDAL